MAVTAREAGNWVLGAGAIPGPLELAACTLCVTPPRLSRQSAGEKQAGPKMC